MPPYGDRPLPDPAASLAGYSDSSAGPPTLVERASAVIFAALRTAGMAKLYKHRRLAIQFVRFGAVGTVGVLVDNAFVYTAYFAFDARASLGRHPLLLRP